MLTEFEAAVNEFLASTSKYGPYSNWTNPYLSVWTAEGNIDDLLIDIELEKENVSLYIL